MTLAWISACTPEEKQVTDPEPQAHPIRSMLHELNGDTTLYWEFFYTGKQLDSIICMGRNIFYTVYYRYLFRKSGDTTIIFRGDMDSKMVRAEAFLSDPSGYIQAYTLFDDDQTPNTVYFFNRNTTGELDSVRSNTINVLSIEYAGDFFFTFEYAGDFIESYKTYYYTPSDGLVYVYRNEVSYDPTRKRKEGLPVPFYSVYGSDFYMLDIHNFGKGSDKLVTSVTEYNPDGSLFSNTEYHYPVYTDTLVVCEPSGTVWYGKFTYRYY